MIGEKTAVATIAVKDIGVARTFYEETLGLEPGPIAMPGVVEYASGASKVLVYESPHAGTNEATAATWYVGDDLDEIVRELAARGVAFEHYDFPGSTREGDVHVFGAIRNAWLKDPDGNILSLVNG
jgi:catechol-2,3-dioxygenase